MSKVMGISYCGAKNTASLYFSIPFANNIKVISPSSIIYRVTTPMYGDEVNLKFWKRLNIDIGAYPDALAYWQKTPGYKYIYTVNLKKFTVIDPSGNIEFERSDIDSMGDMGISFDIYKSHQFIIKFDITNDDYPFYIPTVMVRDTMGCSNTIGLVDGVHSYISNGKKILDYQYIRHTTSDSYLNRYVETNKHYFTFYYADKIHTLGIYPKELFDIVYSNRYLLSSYDIFVADITPLTYKPETPPWLPGMNPYYPNDPINPNTPIPPEHPEVSYKGTLLFWSMLLPKYSMSLYPQLMPIMKDGEAINNRTTYEIWMIWGFYKYITSSYTTDENTDHEVPSFDLSPQWGY